MTWVGASADQTSLKLDESLINAQNLVGATICANKHQVVILPTHNLQPTSFHSLCISRSDGFCRSFTALDQVRVLKLTDDFLKDLTDDCWTLG